MSSLTKIFGACLFRVLLNHIVFHSCFQLNNKRYADKNMTVFVLQKPFDSNPKMTRTANPGNVCIHLPTCIKLLAYVSYDEKTSVYTERTSF